MAENFRGRKGIIIGGGASGLMAAITAAEQGAAATGALKKALRGRQSEISRRRQQSRSFGISES